MNLPLLAARTAGALLTLFTLAGGLSAQAQAQAQPPAASTAADVQLRIESGQHAGVVRRLALSPDERRLVTVGDDKTARVWSVPEQTLQAVLRVPIGAGEAGRLYGAAFSRFHQRIRCGVPDEDSDRPPAKQACDEAGNQGGRRRHAPGDDGVGCCAGALCVSRA